MLHINRCPVKNPDIKTPLVASFSLRVILKKLTTSGVLMSRFFEGLPFYAILKLICYDDCFHFKNWGDSHGRDFWVSGMAILNFSDQKLFAGWLLSWRISMTEFWWIENLGAWKTCCAQIGSKLLPFHYYCRIWTLLESDLNRSIQNKIIKRQVFLSEIQNEI